MSTSSRDSAAGAGWRAPGDPAEKGRWTWLLARRLRPPEKPFNWISVDALLKSYNDILTKFAGERIIWAQRRRWMEVLRQRGELGDLVVDRTFLRQPRFLVIGDPGEGDASQYCVATAIRSVPRTDFLVLCSDVIYPAGDVNDYADRFYIPYADYADDVFALPGNHDWYDLLHGFMYTFCQASMPFGVPPPRGIRELVARLFWRRARQPEAALLDPLRAASPPWRGHGSPVQPASYYAIDTGPVRLVCIDTGVRGELDADQGAWLERVSAGDKPKVLLTGKPLIVDYKYKPGGIEGSARTVDDIVRDPSHNYVAAIGGDIHNYQRYPVRVEDGRTIQYVVAGGGGAYMHATHGLKPGTVPPNLPPGVVFPTEDRVRLYPLRGDSLAFYARQGVPYLRRLMISAMVTSGLLLMLAGVFLLLGLVIPALLVVLVILALLGYLTYTRAPQVLAIRGPLRNGNLDPNVASAYLAQRYGLVATRAEARQTTVPDDARRVIEQVMPLKERGFLVKLLSEILDSDRPPFFKHFLHVTVAGDTLLLECRGVTGWAGAERDPPIEDRVEIALTPARVASDA